ncbi:hypothetical protein [Elizabethkingia miricola]|uniref:hypothetical protein n=1 Tax=Elizabethkingia miricola TaxID=172045 RepID=UPI000B35A124|nr:hypothetical protein [Elizabethkingia miricola]
MENKHVILKGKWLLCTNCGGKYEFKFPIDLDKMTSKIELFNNLHSDCNKTWEEFKPMQSGIVNEKAMYWLNNGRVGSSSKAIWNYFMGNENFDISHPYDPDDFSRCYKLLEFIPEWKERILEIGILSKEWKNLVESWSTLTDMYERNVRENWENSKEIGMHKFMNSLIN